MRAFREGKVLVVMWILCAILATHAEGQRTAPQDSRIQQASLLEAGGDLSGAEALLLSAAAESPEQVLILVALERLLNQVDGLDRLIEPLDQHLSIRPRSTTGRTLQLQVLQALSRSEQLESAMEEWIQVDSLSPDPYREIAAVYSGRGDGGAALGVLRQGRATAADPVALSLPLVDLLIETDQSGEVGELLAEMAMDRPDQGALVAERLGSLPAGIKDQAIEEVLAALSQFTEPPHLLVAIRVAIAGGDHDRARVLAEGGDEHFVGDEARGFLTDIAQIARDVRLADLSVWALDRLRSRADQDRADRRVQVEEERLAAGALATGDTARAVESRRRIMDALNPGTEERRRALASWLRLAVIVGDVEQALSGLTELRVAFPQAPELDELSAAVANRLVSEGREAEAPEVLRGVEGPLVLRETAILLLLAAEVESASRALVAAAAGLSSDQATRALEIVTVLKRLEAADAAVAGQGFALAHFGRVDDALALLQSQSMTADEKAAASLTAVAARIAEDQGRQETAVNLRRRIVTDLPDAREWPESALRLGRYLSSSAEGQAEARALFERLILSHPNHPLAPDARRALERLTGGGVR